MNTNKIDVARSLSIARRSRAAAAAGLALTLGLLYVLRSRTRFYPEPSRIAPLLVYGSAPIAMLAVLNSLYWPRMITSGSLRWLPASAFEAGGEAGEVLRGGLRACALEEWRARSFLTTLSLAAGGACEGLFFYLTGSMLPLSFALPLLAWLVVRFPTSADLGRSVDAWVGRILGPDRAGVTGRSTATLSVVGAPGLILAAIALVLGVGPADRGPDLGVLQHGAGGRVTSLQFSPDGKSLATAGEGGGLVVSLPASPSQVKVWDLARMRAATTIDEPAGVRAMAIAPDGRSIATIGWEGGLRLWDAATGMLTATLAPGPFRGLAFAPDGKSLATTAEGGGVALWDLATGTVRLRPATKSSSALAFAPDGGMLAMAADGPGGAMEVALVDPTTGERRAGAAVDSPFWTRDLRFSHDGRTLAVCAHSGLWLHRVTGRSIGPPRRIGDWIRAESAAFSPDGGRLAVVALQDLASYVDVFVLDATTGEILADHALGASASSGDFFGTRRSSWRGNAHCVAISPDGRWLAAGGDTVRSSGETSSGIPRFGKARVPALPDGGGIPAGAGRGGACIGLWKLVGR